MKVELADESKNSDRGSTRSAGRLGFRHDRRAPGALPLGARTHQ